MLFQLYNFIQNEKYVSVQQLSRNFHIDESALEPLLNLLLRKNKIMYVEDTTPCKSKCMGCNVTGRIVSVCI